MDPLISSGGVATVLRVEVEGSASGARVSPSRIRTLLADVRVVLEEDIVLLGLAERGEVGAAYVQRADGRDNVLSIAADAEQLRRTAVALRWARSRGLPVPLYEDVVETGGGVALLQQRLPGRPPERVDAALIDQLLVLCERLRGLLVAGPDLRTPDLYLTGSGPGFCVHESLERYSARSRALLGWVRQVGGENGSGAHGDDLVHLDLHPGNVLVDDLGQVTGVIDWDAAGRGDARLAYTTLLFDLDHGRRFDDRYRELSEESIEQVRRRVDQVGTATRRMFWAHMSLRQVDWSIRFHSETQVDYYLDYALDGLERHGVS